MNENTHHCPSYFIVYIYNEPRNTCYSAYVPRFYNEKCKLILPHKLMMSSLDTFVCTAIQLAHSSPLRMVFIAFPILSYFNLGSTSSSSSSEPSSSSSSSSSSESSSSSCEFSIQQWHVCMLSKTH